MGRQKTMAGTAATTGAIVMNVGPVLAATSCLMLLVCGCKPSIESEHRRDGSAASPDRRPDGSLGRLAPVKDGGDSNASPRDPDGLQRDGAVTDSPADGSAAVQPGIEVGVPRVQPGIDASIADSSAEDPGATQPGIEAGAPRVQPGIDASIADSSAEGPAAVQPDLEAGPPMWDGGLRLDGGADPCPVPKADGFSPLGGFVPGALSRNMAAGHRARAQRLLPDGAGGSWLLWHSTSEPSGATERGILDHFDACGEHLERSPSGASSPQDFLVDAGGGLVTWRPFCGPEQGSLCFTRRTAENSEISWEWKPTARNVRTFRLDHDGNVGESFWQHEERRWLTAATAHGTGFFSVTNEGGIWVNQHLGSQVKWSVEVLPSVHSPEVEPDAPLKEILAVAALGLQGLTEPAGYADELVVAATSTRGRLVALRDAKGVELPLPDDPRCPDVLIARVSADGEAVRYHLVPTAACESLPQLAIVGHRAFVATVVAVGGDARPNDSEHYDIGLVIVDLESGESVTTSFGFAEDDWVHAIAPCGTSVCIAGTTGARSVDTGSTVSYGDGLLIQVSPAGELEQQWTLKSARHTVITHLSTPINGPPLFFARLDGPVTHTADQDPSLGYNVGVLGNLRRLIEGP